MKVAHQPRAAGRLDVAARIAAGLLPPLRRPIDQARRDARAILDRLRDDPQPVFTTPEDPTHAVVPLDEVDLVSALLPRRLADRVHATRRDLRTLANGLRGIRAPHLVERRPRPPSPPSAPVVALGTLRGVRPRPMRVTEVVRETADAVSLYLEEVDGRPLTFLPGQFLSVDVVVDGETLRRAYSIAAAATEGTRPHVTVKRVEGGRVSNHLNDHAQVGDVLSVLGPSGSFVVEPDAEAVRELVLFAGGSGITPVVSILETVLTLEPKTRATLVYGNRRVEDIIFRERLEALCERFGSRLRLDHVLTSPPSQTLRHWSGGAGLLDRRVSAERLDHLAPADDAEYFVCGPTPMMEAVRETLEARGVRPERIHEERFHRPEDRGAARELGPQPLEIRSRSGTVRANTEKGQTLLEAGLAAGAPMDFSCAMGGCAACRVKLVSGDVETEEPNCLTDDERAQGYVLACVSRPASPCTLEIP